MAAAATLAIQDIVRAGLTPIYTAATTDGFYFANNGRVFCGIKCTGSSVTATFQTPQSNTGLAVADLVVTVPATTGDIMVGPFPPESFNDAQGRVLVTFSSATATTLGAFRL